MNVGTAARGDTRVAWWPRCPQQWEQGQGLALVQTAAACHRGATGTGLDWKTQPRSKFKTKLCYFLATSKAKLSWPIPDKITAGKAEQAHQNSVLHLDPVLFLSHPDSLLNGSLESSSK